MRKYIYTVRLSLLEYSFRRSDFLLWRIRSVVSILIVYFLWNAVYLQSGNIFGYHRAQMLTYVILVNLVSGISQSTRSNNIGYEINNGNLSHYLLKPVNYIAYYFFRDLSDKLVNIPSAIMEIAALIFILGAPLLIQSDPVLIILFILACVISSLLFFEINLLISFMAFWARDTWAPRFVFFILASFLSGVYFPLDIFSSVFYRILSFLPFTYLVFFPLKIYLGSLTFGKIAEGLAVSSFWAILLYILASMVWKKGLKIYTSEGR